MNYGFALLRAYLADVHLDALVQYAAVLYEREFVDGYPSNRLYRFEWT
jgi:hypothetical protein